MARPPAAPRRAGFVDPDLSISYVEASEEAPPAARPVTSAVKVEQSKIDRRRQAEALARAEAILRDEPLPPPEIYRLDLSLWDDQVELALYLAENHLCPAHPELTTPDEMIAAICQHCSRALRCFTAGRVIDRVFRLFLRRPEHTLSLDDPARLSQTCRRKVKAVLEKYRERLGIALVW